MVTKEGCAISDAFSRLEPAKQRRILRAALNEFAQHGYAQASTNTIVREADISKGMLFYYFKSKQQLFNYLIDHALDYIDTEYLARINLDESDFIARYRQAAQIKLESYVKDKEIFEFLGSLYLKQDPDVPENLSARLDETYRLAMEKILGNMDTSLFRQDITPGYVVKIITWAMEGYQNELIAVLKDKDLSGLNMKPYWDEFYEFLEVLRQILYRQGGQK